MERLLSRHKKDKNNNKDKIQPQCDVKLQGDQKLERCRMKRKNYKKYETLLQMHSIHKEIQTTFNVIVCLFQSGALCCVWEGWGASVGTHCQSHYYLNMAVGSLKYKQQSYYVTLLKKKKKCLLCMHLFYREK